MNESARILDLPISLTNLPNAARTILEWAVNRNEKYVCVRDVHGLMLAQKSAALKEIHENAGLVTPDGMPLVWICRLRGHKQVGRACGPDLVPLICELSQDYGLRHFFYGGKPGVANRMATKLQEAYPRLVVAGCYSPPFGAMTDAEDEDITTKIASADPHIVWVGLSTPKQEYWMRAHVGRIPGAVLMGVGAAFDFCAGDVKRAPYLMQRLGIESLHRLMSEPRRLWRRYLVLAPLFLFKLLTERFRLGPVEK